MDNNNKPKFAWFVVLCSGEKVWAGNNIEEARKHWDFLMKRHEDAGWPRPYRFMKKSIS